MMVFLAKVFIGIIATLLVDSSHTYQFSDNKCKVCHRKQNKTKLTSTEYQELLTWISSTKMSNNGI